MSKMAMMGPSQVLWRRSKLGLLLSPEEVEQLDSYFRNVDRRIN